MEILGWAANILFFSGGLFKNPRKTIAMYTVANALFIVMYFSLDLHIAAISMSIVSLRAIFSLTLNDQNNKYTTIFLTLISCIIILINANQYTDFLIFFAAILIGISCYYRDDFMMFRLTTSLSQILWIIHSLIFDVYPMLFCCLIILGTNIGAFLYYTGLKDRILAPIRLTLLR